MLKGRWSHTLSVDSKGRLLLPSSVADKAGEAFMVGRFLTEPCLWLHTTEEHETFLASIAEGARDSTPMRELKTVVLAGFYHVTADAQRRILLPERLRKAVSFASGVALVGTGTRVELWDEETLDKLVIARAEAVAARLDSARVQREEAELRRETDFTIVTQGTAGPGTENTG